MLHPESEKVRFAVVGCGHIGRRHAAMVAAHPEAELVALVDVKAELKPELETEFGAPFFAGLTDFFASGISADVVCVCTPNHLHAPQSVLAMEHGCHVVCEKPMALSKAECEQMIYKSLQTSQLVFCVMQNRYSPPSVWLKELVTSGKLGELYLVQINCYWNRDERYYKAGSWKGNQQTDGGTLFTQFSHFVDLMYWLFGDIKNIQGRFNSFNHRHLTDFEDSGLVHFDFVNGGMGSLNYSTSVWDKNMESSLTIIAENGTVKVGGQYVNEVEYCHIKDYQMPELAAGNPPNDYGAYKGSAANHQFIIQNVVDSLKGRTVVTTNALEGLKVVEMIERIYALR